MDRLKYIKLENEDGSYSSSIPLAVDSNHVDVNGNTLTNELANKANNSSINNLQSQINGLASGSPLVASSISGMTDTSRVYVNTTDGHWYWYNGSTWVDGGVYQSAEDSQTVQDNTNRIEFLEKVPWSLLKTNLIYGISSKNIGEDYNVTMTQYGNAEINFVNQPYYNGVNLSAGQYFVFVDIDVTEAEIANTQAYLNLAINDGWNTKYFNNTVFKKAINQIPYNYKTGGIIDFANTNNIKVNLKFFFDSGFVANSDAKFNINNMVIIPVTDNIPQYIFEKYGYLPKYPKFNYSQEYFDTLLDSSDIIQEINNNIDSILDYDIFQQSYIKNGELICNNYTSFNNNSAYYNVIKLPNIIKEIKVKGKFYGNSNATLICEPNGMTNVTDITNKSIHIQFSKSKCVIGYFLNRVLTDTEVLNYNVNEDTEYSFGYTIDNTNNIINILLPTGETHTIQSANQFINCNGQYVIYEQYVNLNSSDFTCFHFTKFYAKDIDDNVLSDNFKRNNGSIGVSPQGYTYGQFNASNQSGWNF